jgi:hypothetical protein
MDPKFSKTLLTLLELEHSSSRCNVPLSHPGLSAHVTNTCITYIITDASDEQNRFSGPARKCGSKSKKYGYERINLDKNGHNEQLLNMDMKRHTWITNEYDGINMDRQKG